MNNLFLNSSQKLQKCWLRFSLSHPMGAGRSEGSFRHSSFVICHSGLLAACLFAMTARAEIPEPDTIFYGKIINRTSGQEYLLSSGTLSWVVRRPDGVQISLTGKVTPLAGGLYSYNL